MFARLIDDFKDSAATGLRLTSLMVATALGLSITLCFLCAAAFVFVLQRYGLIEACLTGAAIFFVVTLIVFGCYLVRRRRVTAPVADNTKSAFQTALADPMLVATGIQIVRAIGVKRLIPLLAVGGLALGFLASRNAQSSDEAPAE